MPIVVNEIVITTNIEKKESDKTVLSQEIDELFVGKIVQQTVEKVLEILEEKKQR
jgi:hypothetical protein